jgi:hypothetical protein
MPHRIPHLASVYARTFPNTNLSAAGKERPFHSFTVFTAAQTEHTPAVFRHDPGLSKATSGHKAA